MVETLRYQLHIYLPNSDNLIAKYKTRAKPQPTKQEIPFKLIPEPEAEEETPTEFEITLDVENADHSPGPQQKATISIPHGGKLKILIDGLVYSTFDPRGEAQEPPATGDTVHQEEATEPEEDEGKEIDWAKVEEIDEKEDEDREEEEQVLKEAPQ
jgi:hypothetical protein